MKTKRCHGEHDDDDVEAGCSSPDLATALLQVVADFDRTLTRLRRDDGSPNATSHGISEQSGLLSDEYHHEVDELRAVYYPKEIDLSIPREEKLKYMEEWCVLLARHDAADRHDPACQVGQGPRCSGSRQDAS
jgi:hypothetical protein